MNAKHICKSIFVQSVLGVCIFALTLSTHGQIPVNGESWSGLEKKVDGLVTDLIKKENLPGMTVAVTKDGKLIHSKGYGYADTPKKIEMKRNSIISIGSVSKPCVTGPIVFELVKQKGYDWKSKKIYGSDGLLGNDYRDYMTSGINRHTPIVAMAISKDDKVNTWYRNGTRSIGSSTDLDKFESPKPYSLPEGKKKNKGQALS